MKIWLNKSCIVPNIKTYLQCIYLYYNYYEDLKNILIGLFHI